MGPETSVREYYFRPTFFSKSKKMTYVLLLHTFSRTRSPNYIVRLKKLKLWTLEERRNRADLIQLWPTRCRVASLRFQLPLQKLFTLAPQHVPTRGHSWKLVKSHSSTDARRFFFSVRVINRQNSLSQEAVERVQEPLDRIRNSRMCFFMDSWSA